MGYAFEHEGKQYTPDGIAPNDGRTTEERNRETERKEIEWLRTAPEKVFLYVKNAGSRRIPFDRAGRRGERNQSFGPYQVTTWLGTVLADAQVGTEIWSNFDFWTHKRAITCRLFGVLYHGWYMESSGNYCRLKRAKKQGGSK